MPEIAKGPWEAHSQTSRHDHAVLPHVFLQLASETLVQAYGRNMSTLKWGGGIQICRLEGMVEVMIVMSEKIMNRKRMGEPIQRSTCPKTRKSQEFSEVRLVEVIV